MNPHYYLMKEKKILRLEEEVQFNDLTLVIKNQLLLSDEFISLNQEQANWRVVIYRDEILELEEYQEWLEHHLETEEVI